MDRRRGQGSRVIDLPETTPGRCLRLPAFSVDNNKPVLRQALHGALRVLDERHLYERASLAFLESHLSGFYLPGCAGAKGNVALCLRLSFPSGFIFLSFWELSRGKLDQREQALSPLFPPIPFTSRFMRSIALRYRFKTLGGMRQIHFNFKLIRFYNGRLWEYGNIYMSRNMGIYGNI